MELESALSSRAETATLASHPRADPSHSTHNGKWKTWLRWFFSDSWALEFLAMTTAIAALAAIAIILGVYNRQPLNKWPHSIKLNTVLSTLATIMKGFLLMPVCACISQLKWLWYTRQAKPLEDFQIFDVASRGPWGAVQLLFRLDFWHMASIGSLVTLLSLASDAFVQQSVSYPLRIDSQGNNTAGIPYAQSFESYHSAPYGAVYASQPLMAAVYDGVFSKNLTRSTSSLTPYCHSGNCTFPSYASLGVCSNCHNVTSALQFTTEPILGGSTYTYKLPNGHSLISAETSVAYLNISASSGPSTISSNPLHLNSDALSAYQSTGTITNISVVTRIDPSRPWTQTAWDCVLSFCAKSYDATESLSFFNETPLDVFDEIKSTIHPVGTPQYYETITFDVPSTHLITIGNQNRTFLVNTTALKALQGSLGGTLVGKLEQNEVGQFEFSSGIVQGFYYNGVENVVKTVASIADALANAMRVSSGDYVQGSALVMKAHIHVQWWWWLILPLVMVILGAIFLGLTVWQTQRSGVPSWRSNVLAVMQYGANTHVHESSGGGQSNGSDGGMLANVGEEKVSDLEVWAEGVWVRLRRRGLLGKGFGLTVT